MTRDAVSHSPLGPCRPGAQAADDTRRSTPWTPSRRPGAGNTCRHTRTGRLGPTPSMRDRCRTIARRRPQLRADLQDVDLAMMTASPPIRREEDHAVEQLRTRSCGFGRAQQKERGCRSGHCSRPLEQSRLIARDPIGPDEVAKTVAADDEFRSHDQPLPPGRRRAAARLRPCACSARPRRAEEPGEAAPA